MGRVMWIRLVANRPEFWTGFVCATAAWMVGWAAVGFALFVASF